MPLTPTPTPTHSHLVLGCAKRALPLRPTMRLFWSQERRETNGQHPAVQVEHAQAALRQSVGVRDVDLDQS